MTSMALWPIPRIRHTTTMAVKLARPIGERKELAVMKRMWVIVGSVVLSLAAAACGGGGGEVASSGGASPAGQAAVSQANAGQVGAGQAGAGQLSASKVSASKVSTVSITLKDFSIIPSVASLPAGRVKFQASNQGPSEHEFVVLKTGLAPKSLPLKAGAVTEEASGIKNVGEVEGLRSGNTKSTTIKLVPGRYLLVCNIPGHYLAGMVTPFTVT
jgi:uncharacterized cupredoxin-like copper-binding protein